MSFIDNVCSFNKINKDDILLISFIAKTGVVDGATLRSLLWQEKYTSEANLSKKLRKLKAKNFIETSKTGREIEVYLTDKGKKILPLLGQCFASSKKKNSPTYLHDNIAAHILARIVFYKRKILNYAHTEEEVQREKLLKNVFPDILLVNQSKRFTAIEVELTQKESTRFTNKIEFYKESLDFEHIFYICSNDNIKKKIESIDGPKKFSAYKLDDLFDVEGGVYKKMIGIWDGSFYKGWAR